ncbi:MAG: circularly permuted type 2 ATP-grasp protein, partial [Nitrospinaceae bacterium]
MIDQISSFPNKELADRQKAAEAAFMQMGITFGVYGDQKGLEKIFPFDIIPRIINARDWDLIDRGVKQRVFALNQFIHDVYNDQKIIKDGVISKEIILSSVAYRKECQGLNPPKGIWCHISGIDFVRDDKGQFYVLEDNLRCPSG